MYITSKLTEKTVQIMTINRNYITVRASHLGEAKKLMNKEYKSFRPCHHVSVQCFRTALNTQIWYKAYSFKVNS